MNMPASRPHSFMLAHFQLFPGRPNAAFESFHRGLLTIRFANCLRRRRILLRKTDRLPAKRRKMNMSASRPHSFMLARFYFLSFAKTLSIRACSSFKTCSLLIAPNSGSPTMLPFLSTTIVVGKLTMSIAIFPASLDGSK